MPFELSSGRSPYFAYLCRHARSVAARPRPLHCAACLSKTRRYYLNRAKRRIASSRWQRCAHFRHSTAGPRGINRLASTVRRALSIVNCTAVVGRAALARCGHRSIALPALRPSDDPHPGGLSVRNLPLMALENLAINIAATRAFLHDCFSIQPTQEEYETMLAFNMMVPPKVRLGLSGRPIDVDKPHAPGAGDARNGGQPGSRCWLRHWRAGAVPRAQLWMPGRRHRPDGRVDRDWTNADRARSCNGAKMGRHT